MPRSRSSSRRAGCWRTSALVAERIQQALRAGRGHDFTAVVAMLGGLLVAAGLLYLIGYNWEALSKPVKLALVFSVWIALHAAGWFFAERPAATGRRPGLRTLAGVLAFRRRHRAGGADHHLSAHYPYSILLVGPQCAGGAGHRFARRARSRARHRAHVDRLAPRRLVRRPPRAARARLAQLSAGRHGGRRPAAGAGGVAVGSRRGARRSAATRQSCRSPAPRRSAWPSDHGGTSSGCRGDLVPWQWPRRPRR
jgi:hypothetical protein